jgi:hypothetical protein
MQVHEARLGIERFCSGVEVIINTSLTPLPRNLYPV